MINYIEKIFLLFNFYFISICSASQIAMPPERTTYTISSTTRLFNKTICTCLLQDDINDYDTLFCPNGYKFNIINAYLFDSGDQINMPDTALMCESKPDNRLQLRSDLYNFLQTYCNESICNLSGALLLGFVDTNTNASCISADIIWNCYRPIATYSIQNQLNQAYSFTYFFYIITLVLSSSCILIGGLFIIRRFVKVRRRGPILNSRLRQNHGYIPSNEANLTINNEIWTTTGAYPPPNYDRIDESSSPINPPPSYNAALLLNYQIKEQHNKQLNSINSNNLEINTNGNFKEEESVVLYRPIQANNLNQNENTNVGNSVPNVNNNTDNQMNDGEILIMLKQPNQQNSNKSFDTVTTAIPNNNSITNENAEIKPPL